MVKKADRPRHIVECALSLAAERGWRGLSLADIAREAKLSLADLYAHYPSKGAILRAYFAGVDAEMLAGVGADLLAEPVRDRLFDVIMRRFDTMTPQRDALKAIARDAACDPCALLAASCRLRRSVALVLEAAGLDSGGLRGIVRIEGLSFIYLGAARVWLGDESEDLARTMAVLDRSLGRVDDWMTGLGRRRRDEATGEAEEGAGGA